MNGDLRAPALPCGDYHRKKLVCRRPRAPTKTGRAF